MCWPNILWWNAGGMRDNCTSSILFVSSICCFPHIVMKICIRWAVLPSIFIVVWKFTLIACKWWTIFRYSILGFIRNYLMLTVPFVLQLLDSCNGFTSHLEFCACFNGCIRCGEKESPSQPFTGLPLSGWRLG